MTNTREGFQWVPIQMFVVQFAHIESYQAWNTPGGSEEAICMRKSTGNRELLPDKGVKTFAAASQ